MLQNVKGTFIGINGPSRTYASQVALKQLPTCHTTQEITRAEEPYDPQQTPENPLPPLLHQLPPSSSSSNIAMKAGTRHACSLKGSRAHVPSDHGYQTGVVREKPGRTRHQEAAPAGGEREGSSRAAFGVENEAVFGVCVCDFFQELVQCVEALFTSRA